MADHHATTWWLLPCPVCQGKGRDVPHGYNDGPHWVRCRAVTAKCLNCYGTGIVEEEVETTELGPDGHEWAKVLAGHDFVETMVPRADDKQNLMWFGWALREAFIAGAEWQEKRHD